VGEKQRRDIATSWLTGAAAVTVKYMRSRWTVEVLVAAQERKIARVTVMLKTINGGSSS
jgi:hypothetical protein